MKIAEAVWEDGWLKLKTYDVDARHFAYQFNQKKEVGEYELRRKADHRSLTANAYAWVLIDKLAEATGETKTNVYKRAVKDVGGNSEIVCVQNKAVPMLRKTWESRGLGWQTDEDISKIAGCTNVTLYYGSSAFDTKQMGRLIDSLIQDCKALDIEPLPPERIESMLREWDLRNA